jgi:Asp/Glu/hydantoin racemase
MNIGIVYTGTTPQLTESLENELRSKIGTGAVLHSYADPDILSTLRAEGHLVPKAVQNLMTLYWQAIQDGADIIYNACSSVGEVAHAAKDLFSQLDVDIVCIDEEMAMEAARVSRRVGVLATLQTTLDPTCQLVRRCAEIRGTNVEILGQVVDAFGLEPDKFVETLCRAGQNLAPNVDIILLAQGSMAWCEKQIQQATDRPVLSSPRFGAIGVQKAIQARCQAV